MIDLDEIRQIESGIAAEFREAIGFAELPENVSPEDLDKVALPVFRFILRSGENGYKGRIQKITDESGNPPSANNNWLWNGSAFSGRIIDGRKLISFATSKTEEGWVTITEAIQD